jgi:hypothetical protein
MGYKELIGFLNSHPQFGNLTKLEESSIYVVPLETSVQPFKSPPRRETPAWWSVYNSLKHDKYRSRRSGTLGMACLSLAALFRASTFPGADNRPPQIFTLFEGDRMYLMTGIP